MYCNFANKKSLTHASPTDMCVSFAVQGNICSPAEASIRSVKAGTEEYLKIVPGNKLVMGFPWYGQR